jgi:multidrug transporter EmrE-like cation transporter
MSHTKTFKITPSCFDHQMIIIGELSDPGYNHWLKCAFKCGYAAAYGHSFCVLYCADRHVDMSTCLTVWRGMSTCLSTQYNMRNE